jgi:hypothetical protein
MPAGRELPAVTKNRNYPQAVKHLNPMALAAIGRNIGFHEGNYDIAANIEFDTIDGYREYCVDQTHLAFVAQWLLPHLESRVAVQFELDNIVPDLRA